MKIAGIICLCLSAYRIFMALIWYVLGDSEAIQNIGLYFLFGIIGGLLYYLGQKKSKEKEREIELNLKQNVFSYN